MAQWSSSAHLPPIWPGFDSNPLPYAVEFVGGWDLALRVFLQILPFSSLHKNQHLQIPIWPG